MHTVLALETLCIPDSRAQNAGKPRLLPLRLIGPRPLVTAELQQRCWGFQGGKMGKATAGRPLNLLIALHRKYERLQTNDGIGCQTSPAVRASSVFYNPYCSSSTRHSDPVIHQQEARIGNLRDAFSHSVVVMPQQVAL